jgi:hypothetical protein
MVILLLIVYFAYSTATNGNCGFVGGTDGCRCDNGATVAMFSNVGVAECNSEHFSKMKQVLIISILLGIGVSACWCYAFVRGNQLYSNPNFGVQIQQQQHYINMEGTTQPYYAQPPTQGSVHVVQAVPSEGQYAPPAQQTQVVQAQVVQAQAVQVHNICFACNSSQITIFSCFPLFLLNPERLPKHAIQPRRSS